MDRNFSILRQAGEQLEKSSGKSIPLEFLIAIQLIQAIILGPILNLLFTMGEEIGWRGFLLPHLLPMSQWKAILLSGIIWGVWHAPAILQGYNYPIHPYLGVIYMTIFTTLLGVIFSWLYLRTQSTWVAGVAHGSMNALGGLPIIFLVAGFDSAYTGTVLSFTGWAILLTFVGLLIFMKAIPVRS